MGTLRDVFGVEPAPGSTPPPEPVEPVEGTDEHFLFAAAVVEAVEQGIRPAGVREIVAKLVPLEGISPGDDEAIRAAVRHTLERYPELKARPDWGRAPGR